MKQLFLLSFFFCSLFATAQVLPSPPDVGYGFPMNSKVTIRLVPVDATRYNYQIISYEPFDSLIDYNHYDALLEKSGDEMTISFIFCIATSGSNVYERAQNTKSALVMRSYLPKELQYLLMTQQGGVNEMSDPETRFIPMGEATIVLWSYGVPAIGISHMEDKKE